MADNIRAFFDQVKSMLPNEVKVNFPAEVQELDTVTGVLTGIHPVTAPLEVTGTSTSAYAHASGVRIDWHTASILNGRRLRGRTFLVPAGVNVFDVTGRVTTSAVGVLETAGDALIAGMENIGSLAVWSRTHGVLADVNSVSVDSLGAVLRSRRD